MIKISQWFGYNEDASQYLLRPGELRLLNNLQARRPGMLLSRSGLRKIYGKYDNDGIYGIFRRATILGSDNDYLWWQKILVDKTLTIEEIDQGLPNYEYQWVVRRVIGDKSRVVDTLDIFPDNSELHNFCVAEDRRGRLFIVYGHNVQPRLYLPEALENVAREMGMKTPTVPPVVTPDGRGKFIESVSVRFGGGSYYDAPKILVEGECIREARLEPIIKIGRVTGVEVADGGAGYTTAPKLTCIENPQGAGFKATANYSSSAKQIIGFDTTTPGTVSSHAQYAGPSDEETYSTKDAGTDGHAIVTIGNNYSETEPKNIVAYHGTGSVDGLSTIILELDSVEGVELASYAEVFPYEANVNGKVNTVVDVNGAENRVQIHIANPAFTLASGQQISFQKQRRTQHELTYNSETKTYTANIETSRPAQTGSNTPADGYFTEKKATATIRMSPKSYGFAVNTAAPWESIETTVSNWQTYGTNTPYLYGDFWEGSDYDRKGSAENSRYGGLQASGSTFVRGFTGTVGGRRAEVYWPDYSKISVWLCTGTYSTNLSQWTRVDVPVEYETVETGSGDTASSKIIRFRVPATRQSQTARAIHGDTVGTEYKGWDGLPDAEGPLVKIYLRDCPDSWLTTGEEECLPSGQKESKKTRLPWWTPGTNVSRPIVDIVPEGGEINSSTIVIEDPGKGWAKGALFALRIYQANAYEQRVDYNTAVAQESIRGTHSGIGNKYVEFRIRANAPDAASTPDGPPHQLLEPVFINGFNDSWTANDKAELWLAKRNRESSPDLDSGGWVSAQYISWQAKTLKTLSTASTGRITSVNILTRGANYHAEPEIIVSGGGRGYGAKFSPVVSGGQITKVIIDDPGLEYTDTPELTTESRPAKLSAVMRATMRGRYKCAYRFADRSETVIKTVTATKGEAENVLLIEDYDGIEKDMVLEGDLIAWNAKVVSVNKERITLDQNVPGLATGHDLVWQTNDKQSDFDEAIQILGPESAERIEADTTIYSANKEYQLTYSLEGSLVLTKKKRFTLPSGFVVEVYSEVLYQSDTYNQVNYDSLNGFPLNRNYLAIGDDGRLEFRQELLDANGGVTGDQLLYSAGTASSETTVVELSNGGFLATYTPIPTAQVVIRDMTRPVTYSDFSPIIDLDAGPNEDRPHCSEIKWDVPGLEAPSRADLVEFWRTSADQSLVYYRTEAYGIPSEDGITVVGRDTLSDEELFNADRAFYQAMPIVLPNGAVNAYRFGQPRKDMAVAVAFQDRLFMGVSTSGEKPNTIFYSEYDEFESFPDINELPIQLNQKSTDTLTALIPFGSMLLLVQHTHTYSLAYNTDPAIDASIQMMSHRGTLHQRSWDIHENVLYSVDESGIYAMSRSGEVQDISLPLRDFFVSELIDFSKREKFFLQIDPRTHILRFFCCLKSNPAPTPTIALCYDIQAKTWWSESYPNSITSACSGRPADTRVNTILLGAVDGNMYELDGYDDHSNQSLTDTVVQKAGNGYLRPPNITVPNVNGAKVQAVVTEGRLVDVVIQDPGYGADYGIDLLTENGEMLKGHDDKLVQGVEYAGIKMIIDPPEPGGTQAEARANFSVLPIIRRLCTVAKDEPFLRILPTSVPQLEPEKNNWFATEANADILTEGGEQIEITTPACEIGMEVIGEFIPLNAFVSHIDGDDVYMQHPDGSPVSILHGKARSNLYPTDLSRLELGGTEMMVEFRKPANTNVPFRLVTGAMQLANEENTRGGDRLQDRSFSLTYTPTQETKYVQLLERFNGRDELRPNSARRSRGGSGSWVHREDSASTQLDLSDTASHLGLSTGVAKATFASRSYTDMTGADQHIQIELNGQPTRTSDFSRTNFWIKEDNPSAEQFVMHQMTVNGVVDG